MKGKSYVAHLGGLALALTLVTTCLMGGTLAKYTTEVTGTGSAEVAKWSFKANEETKTFSDIDLASTAFDNVQEKKIAPGTEGSFDIVIDGSGSEVAIDYTIAFSNVQNKPANLKFYSDTAYSNEITDLAAYNALNGTIALTDNNKTVTKTVCWQWAYETKDGDSAADGNQADVSDGEAAKTMTFDITVTGTQKSPTETTAP